MTLANLTKVTTVVLATSALGACDWLYTPPPAQNIASEVPATQPVVAPAQTAEEARIERTRQWVEQQRRANRNDRPSRNDRDNDRDDDDDDNWG